MHADVTDNGGATTSTKADSDSYGASASDRHVDVDDTHCYTDCASSSDPTSTVAYDHDKCLADCLEASASCPACPSGTADLDNEPITACEACPDGTFSGAGVTTCTPCPAGRVDSDLRANTACTICGVGTYSLIGAIGCIDCPKGTYVEDEGRCNQRLYINDYILTIEPALAND